MSNSSCIRDLQEHSTRGWVYRPSQGWIFDELTPDELASLKVDHAPGTASVRFPKEVAVSIGGPIGAKKCTCSFICYLLTEVHPAILTRFPQKISLVSNIEAETLARYSLEPPVYVGWLWNDEASVCEALGCKVTVRHGWGWNKWIVPRRRPPLYSPERTFIYALVDQLTQEVGYVGKADDPQRRFADHLKDTGASAKVWWIEELRAQGRVPTLIILEEVDSVIALQREQYWIRYYEKQGHPLTNYQSQFTSK